MSSSDDDGWGCGLVSDMGNETVSRDQRKPLWRPVALTAAAAAVVLTVGTIGLTWLLTRTWLWDYKAPPPPAEPDFGLPGALRAMLLIVGGLGGIVALVVAYRRQKLLEADAAGRREMVRDAVAKEQAEQAAERERVRLFTERFGAAATQLGAESAVTRLAGVYAMAALADEWEDQQQQCIDVLCANLRLPYTPEEAPADTPVRTTITRTRTGRGQEHRQETTTASRPGEREVRWTIIRVIRDHLTGENPAWIGRDFDFTHATFDGADFTGAKFAGGTVNFVMANFTNYVTFRSAEFSAGQVNFVGAKFAGSVDFAGAGFSGASVSFILARFLEGKVDFNGTRFTSGGVFFNGAEFEGAEVTFRGGVQIAGGALTFKLAKFNSGLVSFRRATFSGGTVDFREAEVSGGTLTFEGPEVSGSTFVWPDGSEHGEPPPVVS